MSIADKILIVDDNDAGRYIKTRLLKDAGYSVLEAGDGASALRVLHDDAPALVILDVRLPDMSGIDVCREIKERSPSTLVLQTSAAFTGKHDRAAGLVGGADSYLIEPIEPQELSATVESLLRLSRAERQLRASHIGLENLVNERTRELADANARLRAEIVEREKTQDILRHAQKMDVLGQLTGGIAHDFNNLLAIILGNLEMLRRRLTDAKLSLYADNAFYGARRAATLTRQLLSFSRRQSLAPRGLELAGVIDELTVLLRQTLGERVEIETSVPKDLWPVFVDLGEFEAAILNLAVNARDAMSGAGRLMLSLRNVAAAARAPDAAGRLPPRGDYVALSVADTGQGMTPDVLQYAFEPFFTTKDVGHGTGLGLSQVYGFVTQSGGAVLVDTEVGRGTTLTLCLPRYEGDIAAPPHAPGNTAPQKPRATVLVVEDDDHVRAHSVEILRELGYSVEQANTAKSALEILEKRKDIALLFTDIGLPGGMNGVSLAESATRRRPALKVLLTTGYALEQQDPAQKKFPVLPKPFTFAMLGRRLHETLYPPAP